MYKGSVISFITVVWNTAKTIKDAYDVAKMVKEVSELFVEGKLGDKFKVPFDVYTYTINLENERETVHKTMVVESKGKRDSFFYYLLLGNIVQAIIIGALVYGAVIQVYFK